MGPSAYPFSIDASGLIYTFLSEGTRVLTKKIVFTVIQPHFYNIALVTEEDGELLPDTENSNNGDLFPVLWTCIAIVRHFIEKHFRDAVYISGSDEKRQRLYQRMLANEREKDKMLQVFGETFNGSAEPFRDDVLYKAYLVFRNQ